MHLRKILDFREGREGGGVAEEFGKLISENSDKTAGFMLAGINIFWARLIPILA